MQSGMILCFCHKGGGCIAHQEVRQLCRGLGTSAPEPLPDCTGTAGGIERQHVPVLVTEIFQIEALDDSF